MKKKTLTPLFLAVIFILMLGLSYASVPLYDLFCRITGFGGTTQVSKEPPKLVLDNNVVRVRFDTNVQSNLNWDFEIDKKLLDIKPGKVYKVQFNVKNQSNEVTNGVASYNVSPTSFGKYFSKLGCFCFEKQTLQPGENASYFLTFYLDPEMVNDAKTKNIEEVTMSYTFFSTDYYKQSKLTN